MEFKEILNKNLKRADKVIILTHANPDPDAISSVMCAYLYVTRNFDCEVEIPIEGQSLGGGDLIPNINIIDQYDVFPDNIEADVYILVDANNISRVSEDTEISINPEKLFIIDHHQEEEQACKAKIVEPHRASAAELVVEHLFEDSEIDAELAETAIHGIYADTLGLNTISKESVKTFEIVSKLIVEGDLQLLDIKSKMERVTEKQYNLRRDLYSKVSIETHKPSGDKYLLSYVDLDHEDLNMPEDDFRYIYKSLVNSLPYSIEGISWGLQIKQKTPNTFSVSFRSAPEGIDVSSLAQNHFDGGGHKAAAGGKIEFDEETTLEGAVQYLKETLNKTELKSR